ncbi:MAG: GNAT family N-acetyltransferase [Planctomycetota bacterium]
MTDDGAAEPSRSPTSRDLDVAEELERFTARGREIVLRTGVTADRDEWLDCYNSIFPVDHPGVPEMSKTLWDWKYDPHYSGRREMVVAVEPEAGPRILGAYPSQAFRVWIGGEERHCGHITDLMVRHEERRLGPRPGLFVTLGNTFDARYTGRGTERMPFYYGWPVPAFLMGQKYLNYRICRDWNPIAGAVPLEPRDRSAELEIQILDRDTVESSEFAAEADALWERLKVVEQCAMVRDARWWQWRFARHPLQDYTMIACRERNTGALRGIAVYTVGDHLRANTSFLVDWLVARDDVDAVTSLVAQCEDFTRRDQTGVFATFLSAADPKSLPVQRLGYQVWNSQWFVVFVSFGPDIRMAREHWHFTMGESDLV